MLSLFDALKPRESVFDRSRPDTVWNLSDFDAIDPQSFFAENFLTEAMRVLLPEAFKRLEQSHDSAAGIFHLSQAMGGGKTHTLLALGLLARDPTVRAQVLAECGYNPSSLGEVRVLAFSGGSEPTPNGFWGYLAEKVGNPDALKNCYAPLRAPTESEWTHLLKGEPALILLDELPPYFSGIRAIQTGATSLDEVTTIALRNLFQAVHTNKLPNVCIVLTDLAGTAYQAAAGALASLTDAEKEAKRVAIRLSPVNLNTDELYQILRKRLFAEVPDRGEIAAVADGYVEAAERARNMGLIAEVPGSLRTRLIDSYPFHPAIQDLYARVKENSGFRQTRALIRMMRIMVRELWESGRAKQKHMIAAHDYNLLDQAMKSEIAQINSTFEAAVAKDVQASGNTATAQQIDGRGPASNGCDAQDAAKLLFLSSLSTAVTPTLGLHRAEIAQYLAEPQRDLSWLRDAIDRLQETAWYVHVTAGSKLVFRNTENLVAKVEEYVRNATADMREQDLRRRLGDLFKPETGAVYQEVLPLTPLDQVTLESDKIKLVIYRPTPESRQAVQEYFDQQTYKNRVCFLTSEGEPYLTALERAAYLAAIERVMGEPTFTALNENDPQKKQTGELREQYQSRFHQALSEGFTKLRYPYARGLFETELQGTLQTVNHNGVTRYVCRGEPAVKQTLVQMGKFVDDENPEALLPKLERIWPETQKQIEGTELKRLAATTPGYAWHHPRALDYLRDAMVKKDEWRLNGGWVERGPFPKPATFVEVTTLSVDPNTGAPTIRLRPVPANGVIHHSTADHATVSSPRLEKLEFETRDLRHWFLCVDPTGAHPQGPAVNWGFKPRVRWGLQPGPQGRQIMLVAEPAGEVRYTTDGSSVDTSGQEYTEPFYAPPDSLIQARAEGQGMKGDVLQFRVPPEDREFVIDPKKPAIWRREHALDSTSETYRFLEACQRYGAQLGRLARLTAAREGRSAELNTFDAEYEAAQYLEAIDALRKFIADASITLTVDELHLPSGRDLEEMAKDLSLTIRPGEVEQVGSPHPTRLPKLVHGQQTRARRRVGRRQLRPRSAPMLCQPRGSHA
jgi:hypothetical protein